MGTPPAGGAALDIHVFAATSNIVLVAQGVLIFLYIISIMFTFLQNRSI